MDAKFELAVEALDAALAGGASPASAVCAAASVWGVEPVTAMNRLLDAGVVGMVFSRRTEARNAEFFSFARL